MKIFITLKTKMYHGTNKRASTSILKKGFNLENNNCATQRHRTTLEDMENM